MAKEIPLTQGKVALVDDEDYEYLSQFKWYYGCGGYAGRAAPYGIHPTHIFMHRIIIAAPDHLQCDHINGNRLDNRRCNLRLATQTENTRNQRRGRANTSGYKGVCWNTKKQKWHSMIRVAKKLIHLGLYADLITAAHVYDAAAKKYFGEFACLNFPEQE